MSILSLFPITEEEIEDIGSGGTSTAPGQRGGRKVLVDARVESQRCRKFHRVRKGWPFRSIKRIESTVIDLKRSLDDFQEEPCQEAPRKTRTNSSGSDQSGRRTRNVNQRLGEPREEIESQQDADNPFRFQPDEYHVRRLNASIPCGYMCVLTWRNSARPAEINSRARNKES